MKYILAFLLLLPNLAYASCKYEELNNVSKTMGVNIHCDYEPNVYFTPYLRRFCEPLSAEEPKFGNVDDTASAIMMFLSSYPKEVRKEYLQNIYLLSKLRCGEMPFGGTCSDKSIYVSVYTYFNSQNVLNILHHEFSSVLWRHNKLLMTKADIGMISGYAAYDPDSLLQCLKEGNCRAEKEELLKEGFLVAYGKTNIENDFNVYAEYLFTKKEHLTKLAKKYPLVNEKVKLFKKFYADLGISL